MNSGTARPSLAPATTITTTASNSPRGGIGPSPSPLAASLARSRLELNHLLDLRTKLQHLLWHGVLARFSFRRIPALRSLLAYLDALPCNTADALAFCCPLPPVEVAGVFVRNQDRDDGISIPNILFRLHLTEIVRSASSPPSSSQGGGMLGGRGGSGGGNDFGDGNEGFNREPTYSNQQSTSDSNVNSNSSNPGWNPDSELDHLLYAEEVNNAAANVNLAGSCSPQGGTTTQSGVTSPLLTTTVKSPQRQNSTTQHPLSSSGAAVLDISNIHIPLRQHRPIFATSVTALEVELAWRALQGICILSPSQKNLAADERLFEAVVSHVRYALKVSPIVEKELNRSRSIPSGMTMHSLNVLRVAVAALSAAEVVLRRSVAAIRLAVATGFITFLFASVLGNAHCPKAIRSVALDLISTLLWDCHYCVPRGVVALLSASSAATDASSPSTSSNCLQQQQTTDPSSTAAAVPLVPTTAATSGHSSPRDQDAATNDSTSQNVAVDAAVAGVASAQCPAATNSNNSSRSFAQNNPQKAAAIIAITEATRADYEIASAISSLITVVRAELVLLEKRKRRRSSAASAVSSLQTVDDILFSLIHLRDPSGLCMWTVPSNMNNVSPHSNATTSPTSFRNNNSNSNNNNNNNSNVMTMEFTTTSTSLYHHHQQQQQQTKTIQQQQQLSQRQTQQVGSNDFSSSVLQQQLQQHPHLLTTAKPDSALDRTMNLSVTVQEDLLSAADVATAGDVSHRQDESERRRTSHEADELLLPARGGDWGAGAAMPPLSEANNANNAYAAPLLTPPPAPTTTAGGSSGTRHIPLLSLGGYSFKKIGANTATPTIAATTSPSSNNNNNNNQQQQQGSLPSSPMSGIQQSQQQSVGGGAAAAAGYNTARGQQSSTYIGSLQQIQNPNVASQQQSSTNPQLSNQQVSTSSRPLPPPPPPTPSTTTPMIVVPPTTSTTTVTVNMMIENVALNAGQSQPQQRAGLRRSEFVVNNFLMNNNNLLSAGRGSGAASAINNNNNYRPLSSTFGSNRNSNYSSETAADLLLNVLQSDS